MKPTTLDAVNARLKAGRIGVVVEERGAKLSLRCSLPPRPGSLKVKPCQQRIPLSIHANPAGLMVAEAKARQLRNELLMGRFRWEDWIGEPEPESASAWVDRYRVKMLAQSGWQELTPEKRLRLWHRNYWQFGLKDLAQEAPLSPENLVKALANYRPKTRSRQLARQRLAHFAAFCGVEVDWEVERDGYSLSNVKRVVPSDRQILEGWATIPEGSPWRNAYALMATYGLRPHEVFLGALEWVEGEGGRQILAFRVEKEAKTGARLVPPVPEAWLAQFQISDVEAPLPNLSGGYDQRPARQFKRYGIPFTPYSLRHAYSLRCNTSQGFGSTVTAAFMGHSTEVNQRIYQRHMDGERAWAAWQKKESR